MALAEVTLITFFLSSQSSLLWKTTHSVCCDRFVIHLLQLSDDSPKPAPNGMHFRNLPLNYISGMSHCLAAFGGKVFSKHMLLYQSYGLEENFVYFVITFCDYFWYQMSDLPSFEQFPKLQLFAYFRLLMKQAVCVSLRVNYIISAFFTVFAFSRLTNRDDKHPVSSCASEGIDCQHLGKLIPHSQIVFDAHCVIYTCMHAS